MPSPLKFLGRAVGTPGELTYAKDIQRYYEALAKAAPGRSAEGSIGGLPFAVASTDVHTIGSGGGIKQIGEKTVDFGATDGPMTDKQLEKALELVKAL